MSQKRTAAGKYHLRRLGVSASSPQRLASRPAIGQPSTCHYVEPSFSGHLPENPCMTRIDHSQ